MKGGVTANRNRRKTTLLLLLLETNIAVTIIKKKKKDGDLNSLRNKVSLKFEGMNEVFSQSFYWFLDVF